MRTGSTMVEKPPARTSFNVWRKTQRQLAPRSIVCRILDSLPEGRAIAEEVWQRRHRAMLWLLWLHAAGIFVFSLFTGKGFLHSATEGGIVASAGVAARFGPKGRRFRSVAATLGLVVSSAILVHLSGGYVEFHFHYFVTLAAVSLYHDWAPFLTAIGFVAVQHGVVGAIDPTAVYNHAAGIAHPWRWAAIHATFVLAASAVSLVRWKSSEVEALKDPLTWLPNRALFGDRLRQALVRREDEDTMVAVLFVDIDDFKAINDTAGHGAGDKLLIVLADRLRAVVRPADTVARLGGDEFAIVLEGVECVTKAGEMAERILEALRAPLVFEGRILTVTASIGIAARKDASVGESDLVRNADIAMYVAKKSGKGRYAFFEPSMHRAVMERSELAKDLDGAVERGEMHLLYQPINALGDHAVAGFEALVRWNHPRLGRLEPARFIAIAEDTGLIVPIGRWVLETACRQAKVWEDQHPSAPARWMSVNLSPRQLADPRVVEDVSTALEDAGLDPGRLTLEITESAMVGDNAEMVRRLHRLKSLGVHIALDDFGTGYSSLGYLRRLPIDILKIDKTFVDGTDQGAEEAALARAILKIAESIGLRCIAEGVEREGQAKQLLAAGCELAQGYFFSRPVEASRIEALLEWNPSARLSRGRILIVDDEPAMREVVSRRLREAGFETVDAGTGTAALAILARERIDLVVLDVRLPDMDGFAVANRIKEDADLRSTPVLILSGTSMFVDDQVALLRKRGDEYMRKPFRGDEFIENVRTLLRDRPIEDGLSA